METPNATKQINLKQSKEVEENIDFIELIKKDDWKSILLELIKKEKIDPLNIDVAKLAKSYLELINSMKKFNIRIPANAMLCCAILLRFKAVKLLGSANETKLDFEQISNALPELVPVAKIKEEIISLEELVDAIEEVMKNVEKKVAKVAKTSKRKGFTSSREEFPLFFVSMNEKNIEEKIPEIKEALDSYCNEYGIAKFSDIVNGKNVVQVINDFVVLLYMMNKNIVFMWQESFFSEIFIKKLW